MWRCAKCGEDVEENFELCWSCGDERKLEGGSPYRTPSPEGQEERAEPAKEWTCPACGSSDLVPGARVVEVGGNNVRNDLRVEVLESPEAILFTGARSGVLRAKVCGECGRAELFVDNPRELYQAYLRSLEK